MNWITRYTSAIQNHLPPRLQEDVGQEIQSLLEEELEDLEQEQGRPATEEEVLSLIKKQGSPLLVASRYQTQQVLIGEAYFPFFLLTLRYLALGLGIIFLGMTALQLVLHGGSGVFRVLLGKTYDYLSTLFILGGYTTIIFHLVERYADKHQLSADWHPRNLPGQTQTRHAIPYSSTLFDAVMSLVLLGFINGSTVFPLLFDIPDFDVAFVASAKAIVPLLNLMLILSLAMNAINLIRSYWSAWKRLSSALLDGAFVVVFIWLAMLNPLVEVTGYLGDHPGWTDKGLRLSLAIVAVILCFDVFGHVKGFFNLIRTPDAKTTSMANSGS